MDWTRLIGRIAEHADRDAFRLLFEYFAPRIKGFMIRTGVDKETAEEIAQEALTLVWRKSALFDPATNGASAWIFTIARNVRIDVARRAIRSGKAVAAAEMERWSEAAEAPDLLEEQDDGVRIREALQKLPVEQMIAVRMAFLEDRPHSEIAAELKLPLGTVKSRIRLALARLKALLDDRK